MTQPMTGEDKAVSDTELVRDLHTRFERVERAILGDPSVGHRGLVSRVEVLESSDRDAAKVHRYIEDEARKARGEIWQRLERLERRWVFVIGVGLGAGALGGGIGAWLANLVQHLPT